MDVAEQIAMVWTGMLQQMTAAGATRKQIMALTLETAESVVSNTFSALWENGTIAPEEAETAEGFRDVLLTIRENLRTLQEEGD